MGFAAQFSLLRGSLGTGHPRWPWLVPLMLDTLLGVVLQNVALLPTELNPRKPFVFPTKMTTSKCCLVNQGHFAKPDLAEDPRFLRLMPGKEEIPFLPP